MQCVVFQKGFEGRRIQLQTFLHTQTLDDGTGRNIAHHTLDGQHIQTLHQRFTVVQQTLEVGGHTRLLQLFHNESIELVVDHALAI